VTQVIKNLLCNPSYLLCVLAMTNMMFILTAQQYWASDYMIYVLHGNKNRVHIAFAIAILTAPSVGAISGGIITTYLGGYTNRKALVLCFVMFMVMTTACIPATYLNTYIGFIICVWVIIFT
jgi:sugar phosphate permease